MEENVQDQEGQRGVRGGCLITTLGGAHLTLLGNHSQQLSRREVLSLPGN